MRRTTLIIYSRILLGIIALSVDVSTFGQSLEYNDGIVAVVNNEVITLYDVAYYNSEFEKKIHSQYRDIGSNDPQSQQNLLQEINLNRIKAVNELINQKLIYAEFEKKGYQLPKGIIDKRISSIVDAQAEGDWGKFEDMLAANNTTLEEFRSKIRENIVVDIFVNQTIDKNIVITPEEVENYYQEHITEFAIPDQVRLQIIGFNKKNSADTEPISKRVEKVQTLLSEGTDFTELAEIYSDLPNRKKGGDLGWMDRADVRQEFVYGFEQFAEHEVSKPIEIDDFIYILHISEIKEQGTRELDSLFETIKNKLFISMRDTRYENFISDLRKNAYVRVFFEN